MEKESLLARIAKNKKILWLIPLAAVGMFLLIFGGGNTAAKKSDAEDTSYTAVRFYTEELEKRIESLCRQVRGVTEVHVLLTLDGSGEYIYAENVSGGARDYVILENAGGGTPIRIQEICPKIRGVAVVCTRGGDSEMQRTITELLSAALGIPTSRVRVAGT